jgi:hypothetical protein
MPPDTRLGAKLFALKNGMNDMIKFDTDVDPVCRLGLKRPTGFSKIAVLGLVWAPMLVGAGLALPIPASAKEIIEGQASLTQLGPNASAVTWFVDRPDGYHIFVAVETNQGNHDLDRQSVVRFTSRIVPGQNLDISASELSGSPLLTLEITRRADVVSVDTKATTPTGE